MYIIEFKKNVYMARWKQGDPPRTLKLENAKRFDIKDIAEREMNKAIKNNPHRMFTNPSVYWVDEQSNKIER